MTYNVSQKEQEQYCLHALFIVKTFMVDDDKVPLFIGVEDDFENLFYLLGIVCNYVIKAQMEQNKGMTQNMEQSEYYFQWCKGYP